MFRLKNSAPVFVVCLSLFVANTRAFISPTAQMNPMHRPQGPQISLRPGTAGAFRFAKPGLGELRKSTLASFMSEDYNAPGGLDVEQLGVDFAEEDYFPVLPDTLEHTATASPVSPIDAVKQLVADCSKMSEQTATWWLIGVVAISGINFGVVKSVSEVFDSPTQLFGRFLVATLCLSPWLMGTPKKVMAGGVESGVWLALGYISQAVSLAGGTSSSICSFFASLSCIVCPFIEQFLGVRLDRKAWVAAALAISGAAVLELGSGALPTQNDLISLLQPLLFGIYLIRTEDQMKNNPDEAMEITALQVAATSLMAAIWGGAQATSMGLMDPAHITAWLQNFADHPKETAELVYMGALPSALALAIETVVLAKLSSSKTALLFSTEPLFAAVFGASFLGESVGMTVVVGGFLATAACLVRSVNVQDVQQAWADMQAKLEKQEA